MGNAKLLREAAAAAGLPVFGGENAPYVWVGFPAGLSSWDMFDKMLDEAQVVITPRLRLGRRRLLPHLRLQLAGQRGRSLPQA